MNAWPFSVSSSDWLCKQTHIMTAKAMALYLCQKSSERQHIFTPQISLRTCLIFAHIFSNRVQAEAGARGLKSTTTRTTTLCSCFERAGSLLLLLSLSSVFARGGVLLARSEDFWHFGGGDQGWPRPSYDWSFSSPHVVCLFSFLLMTASVTDRKLSGRLTGDWQVWTYSSIIMTTVF